MELLGTAPSPNSIFEGWGYTLILGLAEVVQQAKVLLGGKLAIRECSQFLTAMTAARRFGKTYQMGPCQKGRFGEVECTTRLHSVECAWTWSHLPLKSGLDVCLSLLEAGVEALSIPGTWRQNVSWTMENSKRQPSSQPTGPKAASGPSWQPSKRSGLFQSCEFHDSMVGRLRTALHTFSGMQTTQGDCL